MKRNLITLGAIAVLSLGLAGCSGGGGFSGEEGKVADRFNTFMNGVIDGDSEEACDVMLGPGGAPMSEDEAMFDMCVSTYDSLGDSLKDKGNKAGSVDIEKVVVDGDTAVVTATDGGMLGGTDSAEDVPFTKVDGEWYIDLSGM